MENTSLEEATKKIEKFISDEITRGKYQGALIGLSGGLDSTVTAYLTRRSLSGSLGKSLTGLTLDFPDFNKDDLTDAKRVAEDLGMMHRILDVTSVVNSFRESGALPQDSFDTQSNAYLSLIERLATTVTHGWADRNNQCVVSPTNKTEFLTSFFSVGGHVANIFPLAELYKTELRDLAKYLGVPEKIISKKPTDGITTRKTDEEILGLPYEQLDRVLYFLEKKFSPQKVESMTGVKLENIRYIADRMKSSEEKLRFPSCELELEGREERFFSYKPLRNVGTPVESNRRHTGG